MRHIVNDPKTTPKIISYNTFVIQEDPSSINRLFRNAKAIAGKRPNTIISDGARNFVEAFNIMRGLKKKDTPILTGYQIFEGDDKWLTLIQNSLFVNGFIGIRAVHYMW